MTSEQRFIWQHILKHTYITMTKQQHYCSMPAKGIPSSYDSTLIRFEEEISFVRFRKETWFVLK